jgi:hypothetical protein
VRGCGLSQASLIVQHTLVANRFLVRALCDRRGCIDDSLCIYRPLPQSVHTASDAVLNPPRSDNTGTRHGYLALLLILIELLHSYINYYTTQS